MTSFLSSTPFSPHNDVLSATPDTPNGKTNLVEELKRRGRVCVGSRNYPEGKELYSKGVSFLSSCFSFRYRSLVPCRGSR